MAHLVKIFNALVLYSYNMRALHWKIKGKNFDGKHFLAQDYYQRLDAFVDEVAEMMMMLGHAPKDLKTVLDSTANDPSETFLVVSCEYGQSYTEEQMTQSVNEMFCHLMALYEAAGKDESLPSDVRSKLDEHVYYFRLEARYKGNARNMSDEKTAELPVTPQVTLQPVKEDTKILAEGIRDVFARVKEQMQTNKEYNKKYQEWRKKAKAEGKAFFPALSESEVDEFFRLDTKSGVFVKHPNQLKNMYDNVVKNVKANNYISEQMPIMKHWIQVYTPLYNQVVK